MPAPPRPAFNSSQLVRLLAGLDIGDVAGSRQTLAERLAPWLGWSDAIALFGVLDGDPAAKPGNAPATPAVIDEIKRVRRELAQSITDETAFAADMNDAADFAPCRRAYRAQQQLMQTRLAPLRARLRAALSARSPELARLAALDAVLDGALAEREQHLLAQVPGLLERHFTRLRRAQAGPEPRLAPDPVRQTLQTVLLAELELRLQPVAGLAEALAAQAGVPA